MKFPAWLPTFIGKPPENPVSPQSVPGARKTQSMVEFALIMPILLLVLYGLLEVGRLVFEYSSVVTAGREAARYGSASGQVSSNNQYKDCAGIVAAAQRVDFLNTIDDSNITIRYCNPLNDAGTDGSADCHSGQGHLLETITGNACHTGPTVRSGGWVEVNITASFTPLSGLVPLNPLTLTSSSSRTILGSVDVTGAAPAVIIQPAYVVKSFSPSSIPVGGTSTLTIKLQNLNASTDLTGISFTDPLVGMKVASPPSASMTGCVAGSFSPAANDTEISFTGGTIAKYKTCTLTVNITSTTGGSLTNTISAVLSVESPNPGESNEAPITSVEHPVVSKSFSPSQIKTNETSLMVITITNPSVNTVALANVHFTDTFPLGSGMKVAASPNVSIGGCGGGALTATPGVGSISLGGATVAINGTCTINVRVTATNSGSHTNSVTVLTDNGSSGGASNTLTVVAPPSIAKSFSPTTIAKNGTSTLTFTVTNPNTVALNNVRFSDTFPHGMTVASAPSSSQCNGGTVSSTSNSISLTGGFIAEGPNTTCTVVVSVSASTGGRKDNTSSTVTANESDASSLGASASLTVVSPAIVSKWFYKTTIDTGTTSTLNIKITNPPENGVALTGVDFSDTLQGDLKIANTTATLSGCGSLAFSPALSVGAQTFHLTGGTIAAGTSCTVKVNVGTITIGTKTDSDTTVTTSNPSNTSNTAGPVTLTVTGESVYINKFFTPDTISAGANSTLNFELTNPTSSNVTNVAFSDTLPSGLQVAATPGLSFSSECSSFTHTVSAGAVSFTFSGGTVSKNKTCTISLSVKATSSGLKNNVTGTLTYGPSNTSSNAASASLTVTSAPSISKGFSPSTIAMRGTSTLTFTITSPSGDTTPQTNVSFTDSFPSGMKVANPPAVTIANCGSPTFSPAADATSLSFSGGAVPPGETCTVSVNVTSTTDGSKANTSSTVSSANGGTGNAASATLIVNPDPPSFSKTFGASTIPVGTTTTLTFTITNPNSSTALNNVSFSDTYPGGMTSTGTPTFSSDCNDPSDSGSDSTQLSFSASSIAGGGICTVQISVIPANPGTYANTTSAVNSTNGGAGSTASATLTAVLPPVISKAFSAAEVPLTGVVTLTFTITNPTGNTVALEGVQFTDPLPAGLPVSSLPSAQTDGCGTPTFAPAAGAFSLTFSGGTIAVDSTCTVKVNLTGTLEGLKTNTSNAVTSTTGNTTGNTATAEVTVLTAPPAVSPPTIQKAFSPGTIFLNSTSTLTFLLRNDNLDAVLAGVHFDDTFPTGMQVADSPNANISGCGTPTFTANPGASSVSFTNGLIAPNGSCTVTVSVTATQPGALANHTGNVYSTNGGWSSGASQTLNVQIQCDSTKVTHTSITTAGYTMTMNITNDTGVALDVPTIYVTWNNTNGHSGSDKTLKLTQIQLGSQYAAISPNEVGPSYTFTTPSWTLPKDTSSVTFTFNQTYNTPGTQQIKVYFSNADCSSISPVTVP